MIESKPGSTYVAPSRTLYRFVCPWCDHQGMWYVEYLRAILTFGTHARLQKKLHSRSRS